MHFHKRTLLSVATLGMLAVSVVLMVVGYETVAIVLLILMNFYARQER